MCATWLTIYPTVTLVVILHSTWRIVLNIDATTNRVAAPTAAQVVDGMDKCGG